MPSSTRSPATRRCVPDLIAAKIGSKTAVDVCAYAALLRGGAQATETETGVSLQGLHAALEMSDRWIAR